MKMQFNTIAQFGLFAALASTASAQSQVVGLDLIADEYFTSSTNDFVNDYAPLGQETRRVFGLDWTADGSTLYGIDRDSFEVVTIDPVTGASTATGVTAPNLTAHTGLTAAPDGVTWYASNRDLSTGNTDLYRGDILTGVFTLIGPIDSTAIIDIAMNSQSELYGHSIGTDSLYSIDTGTGLGTLIGPTGFDANFAQGMDFDPATGDLIATIHTGGGAGVFCTIDLMTGAATQLADTTPLLAEMEIAIRLNPGTSGIGTPYCVANANSTGVAGVLSADGSTVVTMNDVTLTAGSLPVNAFGFFIASSTQGFVQNPGGSFGNLCVFGDIGRYVGPGQIQTSGPGGTFSLMIDLNSIPQPMGPVSATAGDSWNFQTWYRDVGPMGAGSNFTNGLEVLFN